MKPKLPKPNHMPLSSLPKELCFQSFRVLHCLRVFSLLLTRLCISRVTASEFRIPWCIAFMLAARYSFCQVLLVLVPNIHQKYHIKERSGPYRFVACVWTPTRCAIMTMSGYDENSPFNSTNLQETSSKFVLFQNIWTEILIISNWYTDGRGYPGKKLT